MKKIIEFFLEYFNACSTSSKIDNKTITVGGVIKGIIVAPIIIPMYLIWLLWQVKLR